MPQTVVATGRWPLAAPATLPLPVLEAALSATAAAPGWGAAFATEPAYKLLARIDADLQDAASATGKNAAGGSSSSISAVSAEEAEEEVRRAAKRAEREDKQQQRRLAEDQAADLIVPALPPPEAFLAVLSPQELALLTDSGSNSGESGGVSAAAVRANAVARARAAHAVALGESHKRRALGMDRALVSLVGWSGALRDRLALAASKTRTSSDHSVNISDDVTSVLPSAATLTPLLRGLSAAQVHAFGLATTHVPAAPASLRRLGQHLRPRVDGALAAAAATWGLAALRPYWLIAPVNTHSTNSDSGASKGAASGATEEAGEDEPAVVLSPLAVPLSVHATVEARLTTAPRTRLVFPPPEALSDALLRMPLPASAFRINASTSAGVSTDGFVSRSNSIPTGASDSEGELHGSASGSNDNDGDSKVVVTAAVAPRVVVALNAAGARLPQSNSTSETVALAHAKTHPQDLVIANEPVERRAAELLLAARVTHSPALAALADGNMSDINVSARDEELSLYAAAPPPFLYRSYRQPSTGPDSDGDSVGAADGDGGDLPEPPTGLCNVTVHSGLPLDLLAALPVGGADVVWALLPPPPAVSAAAETAERDGKLAAAAGPAARAAFGHSNRSNSNNSNGSNASGSSALSKTVVSARKRSALERGSVLSEPALWLAARALRPRSGRLVIASADPRVWDWISAVAPETTTDVARLAAAKSGGGAGGDVLRALGSAPRLDELLVTEEVDPRIALKECQVRTGDNVLI